MTASTPRWFEAIDIAIADNTPFTSKRVPTVATAQKQPAKFAPFCAQESAKIERTYQAYIYDPKTAPKTVLVKSDLLYEVNVETKTIAPAYWPGPVFEIRRGTWFYDGSEGFVPFPKDVSESNELAYSQKQEKVDIGNNETIDFNYDLFQAWIVSNTSILNLSGNTRVARGYDQVLQITNTTEASISAFNSIDDDDSPIDHLIFVVHGIGQRMVARVDDKPFVEDCGILRETIKSCAADMRSNNGDSSFSETDDYLPISPSTTPSKIPKGSGVQVLPIQWRHKIQFESQMNRDKPITKKVKKTKARKTTTITSTKTTTLSRRKSVNAKEIPAVTVTSTEETTIQITTTNDSQETLSPVPRSPTPSMKSFSSVDEPDNPTLFDVTLPNIDKIRGLVSDVALDVLLYLHPTHRQSMITAVSSELNEMYQAFIQRHPNFKGKVSIYGHSLGSLLTFDILCNQPDPNEAKKKPKLFNIASNIIESARARRQSNLHVPSSNSSPLNFHYGLANDTDNVKYPKLAFQVDKFFAVGSPIGLFMLLQGNRLRPRGSDNEKEKGSFVKPACNQMFNIFHPYDPVAYRIEPHIFTYLAGKEHIQVDTNGVIQIDHLSHRARQLPGEDAQQTENRSMFGNVFRSVFRFGSGNSNGNNNKDKSDTLSIESGMSTQESDLKLLNRHGRIDYGLQTTCFNQYVSAISSHTSYWASKPVAMFIMRELYPSN